MRIVACGNDDLFLDTSALGKRYIAEVGSAWMLAQVQPVSGHLVLISELTTVELRTALTRRQRLKQLSPDDGARLRDHFLTHVAEDYLTILVDAPVLRRARDLVVRHPLRTLDAVQLSCALEATSSLNALLTFVSADTVLLTAAAEGFVIENPLLHT